MEINVAQFLADVKQEVSDVCRVYGGVSEQSYRDGVLEGLRLGCIIVKDALAAEDNMEEISKQLTTLSLRLLKDGYCTLLFRALCMNKGATVGVRNATPMKGGNTDNVYNTGDSRLAFAESLKEQHPDCVEVVWKFNRWHHQVDYSRFKQKLILKQGVTKILANNEYGMRLVNAKESPVLGEESPALDTKEICHTAPNSAMPDTNTVARRKG